MARRHLKVQECSDMELITGSLKGKLYFREVLYKRYFSYAMSIALRYGTDRDQALEIVNDSFMKVLDNLEKYDTDKDFKNWYARIVINTAIDKYRKMKSSGEYLDIETSCEDAGKEPEVIGELGVDDILSLFYKLPEIYKLTFNLHEIEGYDHNEIAAMLGISPSTSRSNLTRAKKKLRDLYKSNINSTEENNEAV